MKRYALLGSIGLLVLNVGQAEVPTLVDLSSSVDRPSATAILSLQQVQRSGTIERAADGVMQQRYVFQPSASPQIVIAAAGGSWNWSAEGELHLRVQNAMPWAVTMTLNIDGVAGDHLQATLALPAGPAQTVVVPLHATSPRGQGMQAAPPMPFDDHGKLTLLATTVEGSLNLRRVVAIRLGMPAPQSAQSLLLGRVETLVGDTASREAYAGIIDGYGQFTRAQWPEKITSDMALRTAHFAERSVFQKTPGVGGYGGRKTPGLTKTGWFHTQKQNGRWQLVTPDGQAFFSLGVNAVVADEGRSYVQGREFMFSGLPADSGAWTAFYGSGDSRSGDRVASQGIGYDHGRWFDFYAANLYRVDGTGWAEAWRRRTLQRLHAWGFNTVGNWSDPALGQAHRLAYTRSINIAGDFANVASGYDYWGRMPDPFDPRFVQAADRAVRRASEKVSDDPWLLGYFADNELAWAGIGPQGRWGLAFGTLSGNAASPAKQAFIEVLRKKYVSVQALSSAWGIALNSWDALNAAGFAAPTPSEAHSAIAADYSAWLRTYAEAYFRTVAEALHRHDPHHMFLGGRFAVNTPESVAACARYCNVVSFNVYADLPQHGFDAVALRALDKPALIGEFHFGSDDRGAFGKGVVSVWNEQQRGEAYARFVAAAAADPNIVGAHWFEYIDQPTSGRLIDGENSHIGLVSITDIPFNGFVEAVTMANRKALEAH